MKKKGKEILSIALCLSVAGAFASVAGFDAFAADPEEGEPAPAEKTTVTKEVGYCIETVSATAEQFGKQVVINAKIDFNVDEEFVPISGIVYNSNNEPLSGVTVTVYDSEGNALLTGITVDGTYELDIRYRGTPENFTVTFEKEGYDPVTKAIVDVQEPRVVNTKFTKTEEEVSKMYAQCFVIDPVVSKYGEGEIDEYGLRLEVNEDAIINKVGVYMYESEGSWRRTIAFTGENITSAYAYPYVGAKDTVMYDYNNASINRFEISKGSDGIYSISGSYSARLANLEDKNGNYLTLRSKDIVGKNVTLFIEGQNSLDDMKAWLLAE